MQLDSGFQMMLAYNENLKISWDYAAQKNKLGILRQIFGHPLP